MTTSTDIQVKQPDALAKATARIEDIIKECSVMVLRHEPALVQAVRMARGMKQLRDVLTQGIIDGDFMPLQNSPLGFLTDKPEGYDWETVRDCLVEALMRGFRPINNEFNIIAKRFYGAKNGFERNVREFPGLRDLQYELGVPALTPQGALVGFSARWFLDGEEMTLTGTADGIDTRIPVRVNQGMGPDAILGKATRKMLARIYNRITGVTVLDADAEPGDVPPRELPAVADPSQDGKRIALGKATKNGTAPAATKPADESPEPGSAG
jgi:hypothetical protein